MKRFLLNGLIFLSLLFFIDLAFDTLTSPKSLKKINSLLAIHVLGHTADSSPLSYNPVVSHIVDNFSEDILILGSSRAARHYSPRILTDSLGLTCYNAGVDGAGIVLAFPLAELAVKRHRPSLIIYELTPEFDLAKGDNLQYLRNLRPYFSLPEIRSYIATLSTLESLKMRSALYRLNSSFFSLFKGLILEKPKTSDGYVPLNSTVGNKNEIIETRPCDPDPVKLRLLRSLVHLAEEHDIKLVFTISPIYRPVSTSDYHTIKTYIQSQGAIVIDQLTDPHFSSHFYFADHSHLNHSGAILLTTSFILQLQKIEKTYIYNESIGNRRSRLHRL